jgi:hypothetical protein
MPLFSERERGPRARTKEEITANCWKGIVSMIRTRLDDGSFGLAYPETCPDGNAICGVNMTNFEGAVAGLALPWPPDRETIPDTFDILDLIEFCFEKVAQVHPGSYHSFFQHYHLAFSRDEGRLSFQEEINRLFSRSSITYELDGNGYVKRLAPAVLGDALAVAMFRSGDRLLDELLETARQKFLQPKPAIRQEALEKLWDAWERIKTLEDPAHKKNSIGLMLDKASPEPNLRMALDSEAAELTRIGNNFTIRHTEVGKTEIASSEHIDYLFHRMFALIRLLLRATGRGG